MEVVYWEGGLLRHEVEAIETMRKTFQEKVVTELSKPKVKAQSSPSMWPWKGYAGFRFADSRGKEGEFDLVIVTHKNVLIVELKHWHGKITSNAGKWYQNGDERDRSPVSITQNKVYLLQKKLNAIKSKFPDSRVPTIKFCVVLSGNCNFDELPDAEREHVLHLNDFLMLANENQYNKKFRPHPDAAGLNQHFEVFDQLLKQGNAKPKELMVDGFRAGELIFEHPGKVYVEYQATNENNKAERALLRMWDFSKLDDIDAKTPEGRFKILSRERDVLVYLGQRDLELSRRCLKPIKNPSKDSITQEFSELCELPAEHYRLNEFINRYVEQFPETGRIKLAKIMVAQFATMHGFKVAHRDLGDHSIWFSPSSAIALSNFIAAYHQPVGTVGPRRDQLSIGAIELPEDRSETAHRGTPFHRDVFALGMLCWHLIQAKPLPLKLDMSYIESVRSAMQCSGTWYADVLISALNETPDARYADAGELLDKLNQSTPVLDGIFDFDPAVLEPFALPMFTAYKAFPGEEEILDTEDKEVYRSGLSIVKLWPSIHANTPQGGQGAMLLAFFEKLGTLQKSNYEFLPIIEQFGYGKGGMPFLVQHYIAGLHWSELPQVTPERALAVIRKLMVGVECLHEQLISHGDLHPNNIKVLLPTSEEDQVEVYLLDMPDLSASGAQPFNNRYSPLRENCTTFERDNFAVMRMAVELLGMDWDEPGDADIPEIRAAITHERDSDSGFIALERFRDALDKAFQPKSSQQPISVEVWGHDEMDFTIYPDNGRIFISIEPARADTRLAAISFQGVGGRLSATYDPTSKSFEKSLGAATQETVNSYASRSAVFEVDVRINVSVRKYSKLKALTAYMAQQPGFDDLVSSILSEARAAVAAKAQAADATQPVDIALDEHDEDVQPEPSTELKPRTFSVSKIWKAILDTESEALPMVEVADEPKLNKDKLGLMIPYTAQREVLESFSADDIVLLSKKKGDKTFDLGTIDVRKSTKSELYLVLTKKASGINTEDLLYLQSNSTRSSFTRREKAMKRVLERLAVVPQLVDYFDEACDIEPERFGEPPTEEHFKVYERQISDGQMIGLNDAQKEAFSRLVSRGPLGLLQGPPGTGKTEFIAAFCHYLVSQEGVRNILLVSQSHEAVNTAAERIRAHCRRLDTDLDVVRFSTREHVVSDELRDVYSRSIVTQQQQSFRAELKHRLSLMAPSLGVSSAFIESLLDVQCRVFGLVRSIERLDKDLDKVDVEIDTDKHKKATVQALNSELQELLREDFNIQPDPQVSPRAWLEQAQTKVASDHGGRVHELNRCLSLIQLSDDLLERMASERANYDEFLVRSRTLVCGTCVGIGLHHLKLAENRFDWVIIDEAARSSPTELAIAMQVGRRILLVGDHRQLPPFYEDEHKKAIARQLETHPTSAEFQHVMRSDFERAFESAYGRLVSATLKTQYRMQPAIGDIVSEVFYQGQLETGKRLIPAHFDQSPECISSVFTWLDTGVLGKKAHHQEQQGSTSLINHAEADAIIRMLKNIEDEAEFSTALVDEMSESQEPAIGIICMYGEQKKLIRRKFAEQNWSEEFKRLVKIDTVDSYQGKENRIVIISLTRSNSDLSPGFLRSPNRINVAISRAMDRLVIVGDMRMWAGRNAELPLGKVTSYIRARQHEESYAIKPVEFIGSAAK